MILYPKPIVKFDPTNKEHREVIRGFLKTGRMEASFQFLHDSKYISVSHQCQVELLTYLLDKEATRKKEVA